MAGTLPRDHLRHVCCGRVCVPEFLHGQFAQQLGGDPDAARDRLRAWYLQVLAGIPDSQPIGDEPVKFWRAQFAAWLPSAVPTGKAEATLRRPPTAAETLAQLDAEAAEFAR